MKTLVKIVLSTVLLASTVTFANAQCKMFTEKNCKNTLGHFTNNGQYNGAVLFEGEEATLAQTFYGGQDYKVVLCTQDVFNQSSYFELHDYKGNMLFSSEGSGKRELEFGVENTQNLKIRVVVPTIGTNEDLKQNGCVSIIVGFKESDASDSAYNETQHE